MASNETDILVGIDVCAVVLDSGTERANARIS